MKHTLMMPFTRLTDLRQRRDIRGLRIVTNVRLIISVLWIMLLLVCVTAVGALQIQANEVAYLTLAVSPAFEANDEVLQVMTDAETALLGYQASHDPRLLQPYRDAKAQATTAMTKVQDKLEVSRGYDKESSSVHQGLEASQRLAVEKWWAYAVRAQVPGARDEQNTLAQGDALFAAFRQANAALGRHLTNERDEARSAVQTFRSRGIAASITVTLMALVLALLLGRKATRSMSRPMAELRDTMARQRGGESDARAREDQGSAELRSLAADFNALTGQNLDLNAELTGRLTELRKANINLRETQHLLTHQTLHDPLTRLPNRTLFLDRLDQSLAEAQRSGRPIAVYFIDIDDFKQVNDTHGHSAGDQLLRDVAARLTAVVRPGDTVARFAGDEFLMLTVGANEGQLPVDLADRVMVSLLDPPLRAGQRTVTASMGVAFSGHGATAEQLLRQSDAAMYQAKRAGGARWKLSGSEPGGQPAAADAAEQRL
ncbi:MAG: diguanylate cyclase [Dermatophilaceae bacterium]